MKTREQQMTSGGVDGYSNFIGDDSEYRTWFGFIGQHRDSDALERSNYRVAVAGLEEIDPDGNDWREESYGHWGVGWIEEIYVRPDSDCFRYAEEVRGALADYPVLSDEDFSSEESEEANEVWSGCFSDLDRLSYIRENRTQFYFHDFADLRACVRGEHFAGERYDLLH